MKAEQIIELIRTLESVELERLFVMIKEYEAGVRKRTASNRWTIDEEFEQTVEKVFTENKELFRMLAELERKEKQSAERNNLNP